MQTPGSPVNAESSGGRKTSKRIVLVCHGVTQKAEVSVVYIENGKNVIFLWQIK